MRTYATVRNRVGAIILIIALLLALLTLYDPEYFVQPPATAGTVQA